MSSVETTSRAALLRAYDQHRAKQWLLISAGLVAVLVTALISTGLGVQSIGPLRTLRALLSPVLPEQWRTDIGPTQIAILYNLRLPRAFMAIIGGAALSLSGVALQGITRNPLVSPYTLGITPAASFGAAIAVVLGAASMPGGRYMMVATAFIAAMVCATGVLSISSMRGVTSVMLILCGIALTFLFSALTDTIRFIATEQELAIIVQWTFGSLNGITWEEVGISAGILVAVFPVLRAHAWALNAFAAGGDDVAASLGFAVGRTRIIVTLAAVLAAAGIVSFTGVILFLGLVAPHIARMLIGGDHRTLIPFAAIVGALILLVADMIGRLAFAPIIIPVGIVVSYLGVPIFLHLLLSRRRELLS